MEKVSVVIITVDRQEELARAIKSVLKQTYDELEIIVVIDGKNEKTKQMITTNFLEQSNLVVHETGERKGGNFARNFGIQNAKGKYIALLDDDDEWDKEKIKKQVEEINKTDEKHVIFNSVFDVRSENNRVIRPRKKYNNQNVSDYLFEYSFAKSSGFIQTSTLFSYKEIFLKFPFDESLSKHQDWDWIVQTSSSGIPYRQINEPLIIYHNENQKNRVGRKVNYKNTLFWITKVKNKLSRKTYETIVYTVLIPSILEDPFVDEEKKERLIKSYKKEINIKTKMSFTYIKYFLFRNRFKKD